MASSWVKSLQCKANAVEDVYDPNPKNLTHLLSSSSCRKSVKDVVEKNNKNKSHHHTRKLHSQSSSPSSTKSSRSSSKRSISNESDSSPSTRVRTNVSSSTSSLTELPQEHPSYNVVQIIFHTSWSPPLNSFSGRIDMVFKVHNPAKTVTRFEEYREIVKSRAGSAGSKNGGRCIADGNEVMGFYCVGPTVGAVYDLGGLTEFSGKNRSICLYSGSGLAHESGGGGKGTKAMLVCRVIAGTVCKRLGVESFLEGRVGFDSVSGDKGELFVFDARAVLPCFLVIYKP